MRSYIFGLTFKELVYAIEQIHKQPQGEEETDVKVSMPNQSPAVPHLNKLAVRQRDDGEVWRGSCSSLRGTVKCGGAAGGWDWMVPTFCATIDIRAAEASFAHTKQGRWP